VPITDISNIDDWKVRDTRAHTHSVCVRCLAHNPSLLVDKDGCMCEQNISHTHNRHHRSRRPEYLASCVCVCVLCVCACRVCVSRGVCIFCCRCYYIRVPRLAVRCKVLQCVATCCITRLSVCCSVLQCIAACCIARLSRTLHHNTFCVLQCVAACCITLLSSTLHHNTFVHMV